MVTYTPLIATSFLCDKRIQELRLKETVPKNCSGAQNPFYEKSRSHSLCPFALWLPVCPLQNYALLLNQMFHTVGIRFKHRFLLIR